MSEPNVVTLERYDCDPRTSTQEVVSLLERLLEEAKAGEIVGVAIVSLSFNKSTSSGYAGLAGSSHIIGTMFKLMTDLAK